MPTYIRDIPTINGNQTGQVFGTFQILGVSRRLTETGNQKKASNIFVERVALEVPVGTQMIIPCIDKWVLGYGEDTRDNPNELKWSQADSGFGMGNVAVRVVEIGKPNHSTSPPTQKAAVVALIYLSDQTATRPWFGKIHYHLLHLGIPTAILAKPASEESKVQTVDYS